MKHPHLNKAVSVPFQNIKKTVGDENYKGTLVALKDLARKLSSIDERLRILNGSHDLRMQRAAAAAAGE
eukprot:5415191-Pyramimonas_sp.AAC.1